MIDFSKGLLLGLARRRLVRSIGRRLVTPGMRRGPEKYILEALAPEPPVADDFRTMLSKHAALDAVPGRVVMVCGSLQPGGAERQVGNTLVGLAGTPSGIESLTLLCESLCSKRKERHDFYLPLARESGATIREIRQQPVGRDKEISATLQKTMDKLHPWLAHDVARLYWEFRLLRPQVVHAWLDWCNVRAGLAAMLAGVPRVLLSGRNLSPRHFALNTDYFQPAYRALVEQEDGRLILLNNSQAGADDYSTWLGVRGDRIKVIRNGVRFTDEVHPAAHHAGAFRAQLGIPPTVPLIGGMFRFNDEKRPLLWLRVAARIAEALPEARFVLFGQGDMRSQMEHLIEKLGIGPRIYLCGVISQSLAGLAPCDLILLTSRGEGTPNVLLEAQWLGLPVVTTDAGGAAEAVNDGITGRVVRSDEEADLADAVLSILRDRAFRATARREGPVFISSKYGMARMIDETLTAYGLLSPAGHPEGALT